jgi:hypothetical protein
MNAFDDRLWSQLVEDHGADRVTCVDPADGSAPAPRGRRRRPMLLTAGAAGLAGGVLALVLGLSATTSTPPAYALTENADGTVTVTLNDVATGIPGLNAEFKRLGIREVAVPIKAGCTGPSVGYDASGSAPGMNGMNTTFTFSSANKYLVPGDTGFIAARQVGPDEVQIVMGAMKAPVPSCFPTTTMQVIAPPAGTSTGGTSTGATSTSTTAAS